MGQRSDATPTGGSIESDPPTAVDHAGAALPSAALPSPTISILSAAQSALARVMLDPRGYARQWGVAVGAGASPTGGPVFSMNTKVPIISIAPDGSWAAWAGVQPAIPAGLSAPRLAHAANLKPTDLCAGLPRLPSGPLILEITTSTGPPSGLAVAGWRISGGRDDPGGPQLISDLQLVGRSEGLGVGFLQRRNDQAWPDGRYDFTIFGSSERTLTICLGQP